MKSFLIKLILFLLPVIICLVCVNYYGDAANIFSKGYEKKIAAGLLIGKNVTNVYNYNERLLQKDLIASLTHSPDVLILGSSRTMLINKDNFSGYSFLNCSVSNSSIEDRIAIMELLRKRNFFPKKIFIGLDPWMFDADSKEIRWQSLSQEYNSFLKRNNIDTVRDVKEVNTLSELFSLSYFNSSITQLIKQKSKKIILTDKKNNKTITRLPDGSIVYDAVYRNVSIEQVNKKATSFKNKVFNRYNNMSIERETLFSFFIKSIQESHCEIIFFLAPFHPFVYQTMSVKGGIKGESIEERELYCLNLAKKYNAKVLGSFNPAKYNMNGSHFYDGMHCNEKGVNLIFQYDNVVAK